MEQTRVSPLLRGKAADVNEAHLREQAFRAQRERLVAARRAEHEALEADKVARKHSGQEESDRLLQEEMCLDLKLQGFTDRQIARHIGVTHGTVQNRIRSILSRYTAPVAEDMVKIIDEQLDGFLQKLGPGIEAGEVKSIMAGLAIVDRKVKMFGLDAPSKVEVTVESESDRAIKDLMNQVKQTSSDARKGLEAVE